MIPEKPTNDKIITISDYYYKKTEIDKMMKGIKDGSIINK